MGGVVVHVDGKVRVGDIRAHSHHARPFDCCCRTPTLNQKACPTTCLPACSETESTALEFGVYMHVVLANVCPWALLSVTWRQRCMTRWMGSAPDWTDGDRWDGRDITKRDTTREVGGWGSGVHCSCCRKKRAVNGGKKGERSLRT
ncbi:hypothetical protein BDN70DRAFT_404043 [Pholiota conissans]|uniref:Uncharacterized protein n=1 Tax=Pholiota conissans TaxID=109636 RepID=A0A9P5YPS3_9AGAR|nr:hypothetical protein BDN70DRAFT_404043 [Pholiota conissans]